MVIYTFRLFIYKTAQDNAICWYKSFPRDITIQYYVFRNAPAQHLFLCTSSFLLNQLGTRILVDSFGLLITKSFFGWHLSAKKCSHSELCRRRASLPDSLATLPHSSRFSDKPPPQLSALYWSMPAFLLLRPLHASTHTTTICPRVRRAFYGGVLNLDIRYAGHRRTGKVPQFHSPQFSSSHWHTWLVGQSTIHHRSPHGHHTTTRNPQKSWIIAKCKGV